MIVPSTIAEVLHGIPDGWVLAIAGTATTGIGWLVKHVTSRSAERATALQAAASHSADNRLNIEIKAFDILQKSVENLQRDVEQANAKAARTEREHGERIAKLERRAGRMNNFIVRLLDQYLQIRSYVFLLESLVPSAALAPIKRAFEVITLPCFDDEVDTAPAKQ